MNSLELTGVNVVILAALVSAVAAIATALVSNVFAHWSAASREAQARNSERLGGLVIEFLQDYKALQISFRRWSSMHARSLEMRRNMDDSDEAKLRDYEELHNTWFEEFNRFKDLSDRLEKYHSGLDVYAPPAVREAYKAVMPANNRAIDIAIAGEGDILVGMGKVSGELEDVRKAIVEAVRKELHVRPHS